MPDLALTSNGKPGVVFRGRINNRLNTTFASWIESNNWQIEVLSNTHSNPCASLVFDSQDNPQVFIPNWDSNGGYHCKREGTWTCEPVGHGCSGTDTKYSDMALDSNDRPHIAWYTFETCQGIQNGHVLRMAYYYEPRLNPWISVSSSLSPGGVDAYGMWPSIALDTQENIHIAHAYLNVFYTYGVRNPQNYMNITWNAEVVDQGMEPDLVLDTKDRPLICYYANGDLKFAKWTGRNWIKEVLDAEGEVGKHASIAVDSKGNPHICYYDETNKQLKYISGRTNIFKKMNITFDRWLPFMRLRQLPPYDWSEPEIIDSGTDPSIWCISTSMAIDANDKVHICYNTTDGIKYCTN